VPAPGDPTWLRSGRCENDGFQERLDDQIAADTPRITIIVGKPDRAA